MYPAAFSYPCRTLLIATQKNLESVISTCFNWADHANSFPISSTMPMKYQRDLSDLRSSSANPLSSLRRHCRNHKKPRHFVNFWSQPNCQHILPSPRYHTSVSHSLRHNCCHSSQPSSFFELGSGPASCWSQQRLMSSWVKVHIWGSKMSWFSKQKMKFSFFGEL